MSCVKNYPLFPWDLWAKAAKLPLEKIETLNVSHPEFFEGATQLWHNTDLEVLKMWMEHSLIDEYASLLSEDFVNASFEFHGRTLSGTQELRPRWKRGLSLVSSLLGEAMGEIWVSRHSRPPIKKSWTASSAAFSTLMSKHSPTASGWAKKPALKH